MATKEPITREEYDALLAEGLSREEINAEFVIAPTATRTPPKQRQNFGGYTKLADAGRVFGQGASFNMGDRARALLRAMSPQTTYAEALPEEQAKTREARANLGPAMSAASELSGALLVPGAGALKGVQSLMSAGGRLGAREVAKRIGVGAGIGAAEAAIAGAGESAPGEMLQGAARAAPIGAVAGGALTALPPAARSVRRYFGGGTEGRATEAASDALRELAARAGLSPEDYIKTVVRPGASGRRLIDADAASQELGVDVARTSAKAGDQLQRMAEGRIATQGADVAGDVRTAIGAKAIEPAKQVAKTAEALKEFEDAEYAKLFSQYPDAITDKSFIRAWRTARKYLRPYIASLPKEQALKNEPIRRVLQSVEVAGPPQMVREAGIDIPLIGTGRTTVRLPTIEGVHRFKMTSGSVEAALRDKVKSKSASGSDIRAYRALRAFNRRLKDILPDVPGGKEYARIQKVGQRARAQQEAVETGGGMWDKDQTPFVMAEDVAAAEQRAGQGKGIKNLRIGAAGKVVQDAAAGEDVLARMSTEKADQTVAALAPSPTELQDFRRNIKDRQMMAETNRQQTGSRTLPKPILQGARNRSTALQFGESMALGDVAGLQSPSQPLRMAFGSLLAKALQGRRYIATERAAELLAELLQRSGNDPRLYAEYTDLARALERINARRLDRAALTGVLGGQLGAQEGASR